MELVLLMIMHIHIVLFIWYFSIQYNSSQKLIDSGYLINTKFTTLEHFETESQIIDTYEYNLKNVLLQYLLDYTGHFVDDMFGLFTSQIDVGNLIAFIIIGTLVGLALLQALFACLVSRAIYSQAKVILNIPIHLCVKAQKLADSILSDIRTFDTDTMDHSISVTNSEAAIETANNFGDKRLSSLITESDHSDLNSKRWLKYGFFKKHAWIWKLALCVSLGFALMMVYYVDGNRHFRAVRKTSYIFNTTGRLEETLMLAENIQRSFFIDRNQLVHNMPAFQALEIYQYRSHEVISLMFENAGHMLGMQSGSMRDILETFMYHSMCVKGMPPCKLNEQRNGFLASLTEFHNLLKMSYYDNAATLDPTKFLNSPEYVKVVDLFYGQIQPAYKFFFTEALRSVKTKNNNERNLFQICLIMYIILSCAANILLWIPDIQRKKEIVFCEIFIH